MATTTKTYTSPLPHQHPHQHSHQQHQQYDLASSPSTHSQHSRHQQYGSHPPSPPRIPSPTHTHTHNTHHAHHAHLQVPQPLTSPQSHEATGHLSPSPSVSTSPPPHNFPIDIVTVKSISSVNSGGTKRSTKSTKSHKSNASVSAHISAHEHVSVPTPSSELSHSYSNSNLHSQYSSTLSQTFSNVSNATTSVAGGGGGGSSKSSRPISAHSTLGNLQSELQSGERLTSQTLNHIHRLTRRKGSDELNGIGNGIGAGADASIPKPSRYGRSSSMGLGLVREGTSLTNKYDSRLVAKPTLRKRKTIGGGFSGVSGGGNLGSMEGVSLARSDMEYYGLTGHHHQHQHPHANGNGNGNRSRQQYIQANATSPTMTDLDLGILSVGSNHGPGYDYDRSDRGSNPASPTSVFSTSPRSVSSNRSMSPPKYTPSSAKIGYEREHGRAPQDANPNHHHHRHPDQTLPQRYSFTQSMEDLVNFIGLPAMSPSALPNQGSPHQLMTESRDDESDDSNPSTTGLMSNKKEKKTMKRINSYSKSKRKCSKEERSRDESQIQGLPNAMIDFTELSDSCSELEPHVWECGQPSISSAEEEEEDMERLRFHDLLGSRRKRKKCKPPKDTSISSATTSSINAKKESTKGSKNNNKKKRSKDCTPEEEQLKEGKDGISIRRFFRKIVKKVFPLFCMNKVCTKKNSPVHYERSKGYLS